MNEPQEAHSTILMKELSDIKERLAVNTTQTVNVATVLDEIKKDVKNLPTVFIGREEYNARHKELELKITILEKCNDDKETRMRAIESKVWKAIGGLIIFQVIILPVVMYFFYKIVK